MPAPSLGNKRGERKETMRCFAALVRNDASPSNRCVSDLSSRGCADIGWQIAVANFNVSEFQPDKALQRRFLSLELRPFAHRESKSGFERRQCGAGLDQACVGFVQGQQGALLDAHSKPAQNKLAHNEPRQCTQREPQLV